MRIGGGRGLYGKFHPFSLVEATLMSLQVEGAPLHLPLRDGSGGSTGPEIETRTRTRVEPDPHTRRVCGTRAEPYTWVIIAENPYADIDMPEVPSEVPVGNRENISESICISMGRLCA